MTEETLQPQTQSVFKNIGLYAHIAELTMIIGTSVYFYKKNITLEEKVKELEKKVSFLLSVIEPKLQERQNYEERFYNKIMEDVKNMKKHKKKNKVSEISVLTTEDDSDIENELKKEM